jgi:bifunctional enzyme CysN/CysC
MSALTRISGARGRNLLRFLTCGSVDDGKSTLIGRLLIDTHSSYDDEFDDSLESEVRDSSRSS